MSWNWASIPVLVENAIGLLMSARSRQGHMSKTVPHILVPWFSADQEERVLATELQTTQLFLGGVLSKYQPNAMGLSLHEGNTVAPDMATALMQVACIYSELYMNRAFDRY